jgi:circadian clock protein KaiC
MTKERVGFGIGELDKLIGGGIPCGSVINIAGPPGSGKTLISLSLLSDGLKNNRQGVQVCFSTVPIKNVLKKVLGSERYAPLFLTDDPIVMDLSDLDRVDILIGLIEDGGIDRLILDHPEVMSLRGSDKWFTMLEELLAASRNAGVTVVVVDYGEGAPAGVGRYVSDGIISVSREDSKMKAKVIKWDLEPGIVDKEAVEEVAGDWTR